MICAPLILLVTFCTDPKLDGTFQHIESVSSCDPGLPCIMPASSVLTGSITAESPTFISPRVLGYREGNVVLDTPCAGMITACETIVGGGGTTTLHMPSCRDGWTLVLAQHGPACARELEPPQ